ncbi:YdcF family protein [Litorimonas sp. RW-G-Af-16]
MSRTSTTAKPQKLSAKAKRRGWLKYVLFIFVLAFAMALGGFFAFAQHVDSLRTPPRNLVPKADGIVVWTGKGGGRLEAAGQLLKDGKGERLLVSGVNTKLELPQVQDLLLIDAEVADCCVDLDYAAEDTIGNARETAA